jgi:chromosome segregation ATPase
MSDGNGTGKTDSRILAAQRQLIKAQGPLQELDDKIKAQLLVQQQTEKALAAADAAYSEASLSYADADTDANKRKLFSTHDDVAACQAKLKVIAERITALQTTRATLDAAVQAAHTVVSRAGTEVLLENLYAEVDRAKYHIGQHQQGLMEWDRRLRAAKQQALEIEQRQADAQWRVDKVRMQQEARLRNPYGPGGALDRGVVTRH